MAPGLDEDVTARGDGACVVDQDLGGADDVDVAHRCVAGGTRIRVSGSSLDVHRHLTLQSGVAVCCGEVTAVEGDVRVGLDGHGGHIVRRGLPVRAGASRDLDAAAGDLRIVHQHFGSGCCAHPQDFQQVVDVRFCRQLDGPGGGQLRALQGDAPGQDGDSSVQEVQRTTEDNIGVLHAEGEGIGGAFEGAGSVDAGNGEDARDRVLAESHCTGGGVLQHHVIVGCCQREIRGAHLGFIPRFGSAGGLPFGDHGLVGLVAFT